MESGLGCGTQRHPGEDRAALPPPWSGGTGGREPRLDEDSTDAHEACRDGGGNSPAGPSPAGGRARAQQGVFQNRLGDPLPSPSITSPSCRPACRRPSRRRSCPFGAPVRRGVPLRRAGLADLRGSRRRDPAVHRRPLTEAEPNFTLAPGTYVATVTYGFASASKRIVMGGQPATDTLRVAAGALNSRAPWATRRFPPAPGLVSVFVPVGTNSEGRWCVGHQGGELLRLPRARITWSRPTGNPTRSSAPTCASRTARSRRRATTQPPRRHRHPEAGGRPRGGGLCGHRLLVLTPGGDTIREAIGAFPQVTLAEGDYVLIARHDGQVYTASSRSRAGWTGISRVWPRPAERWAQARRRARPRRRRPEGPRRSSRARSARRAPGRRPRAP